jgi:tetratricopeptide (TPR) repeat protein
MTERKKNLLLLSYVLVVISLATYFPSLTNGIINWNDDDLFRYLHALNEGNASLFENNDTAPLSTLLLWGQYAIGGEGYFIYHAVNVILHTANALLLLFIAAQFSRNISTAFIVSLLFVVHPVRIGAVSWISQQPLLFSSVLAFGTVYLYLLYRTKQHKVYYYCSLLGIFLFYAASDAGLWPVIVLFAVDRFYYRSRNAVASTAPFFLFWGVAFLIDGLNNGGWKYITVLMNESVTVIRYGLIDTIVRYVLPTSFAAVTTLSTIHQKIFGLSGIVYPMVSVLLITFAAIARKRFPFLAISVAAILLGGLPIFTGRITGEWILNDAAVYVSSVGICILIAALWHQGVALIHLRSTRIFVSVVAGVVLLTLTYSTFLSQRYWKGSETFWNKALSDRPEYVFALNKLALYHHSRYEIPRSLDLLNTAVLIAPDDIQSRFLRGFVHLAYMNIDSSIADLQWVVAKDSGHTLAYLNLGIAHDLYFRYDDAVSSFSKAIELTPDLLPALNSRGNSFAKQGNFVAALSDYQRAIDLNTLNSDVYGNRGMVYLQIGNAQSALYDFQKQSELSPRRFRIYAHIGLTAILIGDTILGNSNISRAISIDSVNARLYLETISSTFFRTKEESEVGAGIFSKNGVRYQRQ